MKSKEESFKDLKVHFLNVGKADSAYIRYKDYNILIDAADKEPLDTVCEYLSREGGEKDKLTETLINNFEKRENQKSEGIEPGE